MNKLRALSGALAKWSLVGLVVGIVAAISLTLALVFLVITGVISLVTVLLVMIICVAWIGFAYFGGSLGKTITTAVFLVTFLYRRP